ncbi:MAG: PEP-CTERM sorting domain-containing protein [Nibricoccus sp.]
MKKHINLFAVGVIALTVSASAQIVPDPAGTNTFAEASAFNKASYEATFGSGGAGLYFASQLFAPSPTVNSWSYVTQTSDLGAGVNFLAGGGTIKTIFLGESAGSGNDFGFIKVGANLGSSASYQPLATNIVNTNTPGGTIQSGWETYAHYGAGEKLDFWLNNPGTFTPGGAYFAFLESGVGSAFAGGDPYSHVKFSWTSVLTEYLDGTGTLVRGNVDTLLIAFEDMRGPVLPAGGGLPTLPPGDADFTDFIVGFQFLPSQQSLVPEPSTYGLFGAAGLLALLGYRRFKASAKASA